MVGNFIYIIVLIIVVFIFLIVPVGIIARMVFNRAEQPVSLEELEELEDHVKNLLFELQSTVEKNTGLLDERLSWLRELLEQADQKIALIEQTQAGGSRKVIPIADEKEIVAAVAEPEKSVFESIENEDVNEKIEKMALAGIKIEDIAKELNMHSGEIQLMLGLRGLQAGKISKSKQSKSGT